jgi:hypothetical protein
MVLSSALVCFGRIFAVREEDLLFAVCLDEGFSLQLWGQLRGWFQVLVRWAVGFPPDQGEKSA